MSKYKMMFLRRRFLIIISMLTFLIVGGLRAWAQLGHSSNGTGQNPDKILENGNDFNPPVKITLVKSNTGEIETNKKLSAGDDWLKGLAVRVLNTSDKPVTHVTVELRFRRPKDQAQELDVTHALRYGPDPFFPSDNTPSIPTEPLLPGQSIDITFPDDEYDAVRSILSQHKYPASLKAVKLLVRTVGFSDGTSWSAGAIFKRDPNNPDKWIRVNQSQAMTTNLNTFFFKHCQRRSGKRLAVPKSRIVYP